MKILLMQAIELMIINCIKVLPSNTIVRFCYHLQSLNDYSFETQLSILQSKVDFFNITNLV